MATLFTHAVVAIAAGNVFARRQMRLSFWVLSILCAVLPDVDVIGFYLGVPYDHFFGHRGFTHSLLFAAVWGFLVASFIFRDVEGGSHPWLLRWVYFSAVTASHGALDAMTNGGFGVAFYSPFDPTRFFFTWRPIEVAPIGVEAGLSEWGLQILLSELVYVWTPMIVLLLLVREVREK